MIKRFDFYIIRTLLVSMFAVMLCLLLLMTMFGFVDEARGVDETRSFLSILAIVLLDVPSSLAESVTYIVLVGVLIGLGAMSQNSEITVLRASGLSPWRLCISVAVASLIFFGGVVLVSELMKNPVLSRFILPEAASQSDVGTWYREGNTFYQIHAFDDGGNLYGMEQFTFQPDNTLESVLQAEIGVIESVSKSFVLSNVTEKNFTSENIQFSRSPSGSWVPHGDPSSLKRRILTDPSQLSLNDLFDQIEYLHNEGKSTRLLEITAWTRLTKSLSIIGLVLVAVGFVIGPLRETGMGTRIAVGLGVGIVLEYLNRMLVPLALLYEIPPVVVVLLPLFIIFTCGIYLLRKVN
ncbi:MAG: LPS export ABC transporter permease LptG [Gammaproteobacteria bacterium]|nr:LPS export ABC transporter permease LptG [Gammaproteobacteria bacterium]MDE0251770.1 LPS export ABC transporter permease LptG [Gammaproteobacteria bacterium]MDE0403221.1 LPS export ABC transporter permease LptG [Gammaproteobacteria bacterium]